MRNHRESKAQSDARAYIQRARKSKLSDKTPLICHTWLRMGKKGTESTLTRKKKDWEYLDTEIVCVLFDPTCASLPLSRHHKNERNKQLQEPMGSWQSVHLRPICFKTRRYKEPPATYNKRTVLDNSKQFCRTTAAINLLNWHRLGHLSNQVVTSIQMIMLELDHHRAVNKRWVRSHDPVVFPVR